MENVNSAALTCRAETAPVTEAQPGTGEGLLPLPGGPGSCHGILGDTGGTPAPMPTGGGGTVLVGSRWGLPGWVLEWGGGSILALAEGGEGAWLPKPDGLDAELLNYEY